MEEKEIFSPTEVAIETMRDDFLIGQAQDTKAMTGCTAIVCPRGAVCAVDVRGGSPGTRDTDALNPSCSRELVYGIMLSGGSAFGLDAAGGLMRCLERKKIGRDMGVTVIPSCSSAILFDLKCGDFSVRPDAKMGEEATENAFVSEKFLAGNFGAGCGATVGKIYGPSHAMKGGIGAAALKAGNLICGAVFAVNCVGDVVQGTEIIAGTRLLDDAGHFKGFADSSLALLARLENKQDLLEQNTVIGAVLTNARLGKGEAIRVACAGQDAIARAIKPAHSIFDGDTVFALASGKVAAEIDAVSVLAEMAAERAMWNAVLAAESYGNFIAARDVQK